MNEIAPHLNSNIHTPNVLKRTDDLHTHTHIHGKGSDGDKVGSDRSICANRLRRARAKCWKRIGSEFAFRLRFERVKMSKRTWKTKEAKGEEEEIKAKRGKTFQDGNQNLGSDRVAWRKEREEDANRKGQKMDVRREIKKLKRDRVGKRWKQTKNYQTNIQTHKQPLN